MELINDHPVTVITVPEAWVIVMPCGCLDGLLRGSLRHPTAEAAWATFTPNNLIRDAQTCTGWSVRPASTDDIERAAARVFAPVLDPRVHEGHAE